MTDKVLRGVPTFIQSFNLHFKCFYLEKFLFQGAVYSSVIVKEVNQIREIFATYAIEMEDLDKEFLISQGIVSNAEAHGAHNTITSSVRPMTDNNKNMTSMNDYASASNIGIVSISSQPL
jgi:hypothetical protein